VKEEKVKRKKPRGETVSGLKFLVEEKVKRKKLRLFECFVV